MNGPPPLQRRSERRKHLSWMVEVFVVGLEVSPVGCPEALDRAARIAIGSEKNAVLVFNQERPSGIRLPAQFLDTGRSRSRLRPLCTGFLLTLTNHV